MHVVDALGPRAEEGRVRLRKASRRCQKSLYSGMSEWGNPAKSNLRSHLTEGLSFERI